MVCGFFAGCSTKNLSVSGGPGNVLDSGTRIGIHDTGRGITGRYNYSASFDGNKHCEGSFYISGTKRNFSIRVYTIAVMRVRVSIEGFHRDHALTEIGQIVEIVTYYQI